MVMVVYARAHAQCLAREAMASLYFPLHTYVYQMALAFLLPVVLVFVCNVFVLRKIYQVETIKAL